MNEAESLVLDHTTKFKKYSEKLKANLNELLQLKKRGLNDKESEAYKNIYNSITFNLISMRINQRELYNVKDYI